MMSDAVLQVLQILAYLAIGLISVTFPIYAISVNYLPQEKWETQKERKKRTEKIKGRIAKLNEELSGIAERDSDRFREMEKELKRSKSELSSLGLRFRHLTAMGAVGLPVLILVISLFSVVVGIHFFYEGLQQIGLNQIRSEQIVLVCMTISSISSVLALVSLYQTILAVEYAALRPARTVEFEICFPSGEKKEKIKCGKETKLSIGAKPELSVEKIEFCIFLPPEIELKSLMKRAFVTLQPKKSDHPEYNMITMEYGFLYEDTFLAIKFNVLANKTGKYTIPVSVSAKGIYEYKTELILNVVK